MLGSIVNGSAQIIGSQRIRLLKSPRLRLEDYDGRSKGNGSRTILETVLRSDIDEHLAGGLTSCT